MDSILPRRTSSVAMQGNPSGKWTALIHLLNEKNLKNRFMELRRDAAPGVDGVTWNEYGENLDRNVGELLAHMKAWRYRPQASRRKFIPKEDGRLRPLAIPAVEDKMVQGVMTQILVEIFDGLFLDCSFGFRPGWGCQDALRAVNEMVDRHPVGWIVDVDIENFFDSVDHKLLMKALETRIADPNFLRLIGRFLRGGVMEEGKFIETDRGTPQGGLLSPVLANIFLHYGLDLWFERKVKPTLRGYAAMVRYADDLVLGFEHRVEAETFLERLKERLSEIGLKVSEAKTRIAAFGRDSWRDWRGGGNRPDTFDFLGFTHLCATTRNGRFMVGVKTSRKRLAKKLKAANLWLKGIRNRYRLVDWWRTLARKLLGHYAYYGVRGNHVALREFLFRANRLAFKWINRRSQKRSMTWKQFNRFCKFNPLPTPKVFHSFFPSAAR